MNDDERRELRKRKNRESAEKNRREKEGSIEILQSKVIQLSNEIHSAMISSWHIRRASASNEPFPKYIAPILEPAEF